MKNAVKKIAALVIAVSMLATCALAVVPGTIDLEATANGTSANSYNVTYTAKLVMPDELAEAAATVFPDARLFEMVFVCNLNDALVAQLESVDENDVTFDGGDIFEFVDITADAVEGITVKYQLKDDLATTWESYSSAQIKEALQAEMTMTATKTATAAQINAALDVSDPVAITAKVTIDGEFGSTGYQSGFTAAEGAAELDVVPYTSVGGGGLQGGGGAGSVKDDDKTDSTDKEDGTADGDNTGSDANVRFIDLGNHAWAADAINALADAGIVKGTTENTYSPANNITRADFAILLVRAFGLTSDNTENFDDVEASDYFAAELAIARNTGIVNGIGDNKYAPRNTITRQDMMVIVYRALTKLGVELTTGDVDYADFDSVAEYAKEAVKALITSGLVNGKSGMIAPNDYTTRAEVAVLLQRILDYVK